MLKYFAALIFIVGASGSLIAGEGTVTVRSVQRGSVDFDGVNSRTVPITTVDQSKSVVIGSWRADSASPQSLPAFALDSGGKSVTINTTEKGNTKWVAEWQVIEFADGVRVERGNTVMSAAILTKDIPIVGPNAKSFPILSLRCDSTTDAEDDQWTISVDILDGTMTLQRHRGGPNLAVAWQVVTLTKDSDSVVKGKGTITSSTRATAGRTGIQQLDATVTAINPLETFVTFTRHEVTYGSPSGSRGAESRYQVRARILGPEQLIFDRGVHTTTGNSVEIIYYLVSIKGMKVKSGGVEFDKETLKTSADLGTPGLDFNRSVVLHSARTTSIKGEAKSPTDQLGDCSFTCSFVNNQTLSFARELSSSEATHIGADVSFFALEFPATSQPPVNVSLQPPGKTVSLTTVDKPDTASAPEPVATNSRTDYWIAGAVGVAIFVAGGIVFLLLARRKTGAAKTK